MTRMGNAKIAVVGMFDGVHAGHRFLLGRLKAEGERLGLTPLAVTFANHPLEITAPQRAPLLLSTPAEKSLLLAAEGVEAEIIPFDNKMRMTTADEFLKILARRHEVHAMLLGFNNRFGHDAPCNHDAYKDMALTHGIELITAPELTLGNRHVSSSAIRALLAGKGDVTEAAEMLQRHYSISGQVTCGRHIGRTIGFPTANITPADARKLIPLTGVYAATATLCDGSCHPAVVNIGHRPTVEQDINAPISIEAHLIGFDGDLYGSTITLTFIARIRPELRFPSLETLRQRIETDRAEALAILT